MNIENFIPELKKIKLWLENENLPLNYREYIGFYILTLDTQKFNILRKGYWSSFFFARITDKTNIALRVFPESKFEDWSVVQNIDAEYSYTICNKLSNFTEFNQIRILLKKDFFKKVSNHWDTLIFLARPLLNLFDTQGEMEFIKDYAFNSDNLPKSDEEKENQDKYLQFWFHYDTSHGHKVMRELIDKLNENKDWLPENIPEGDLGIWETRIKIILMLRAKMKRNLYNKEIINKFIWEGYIQPHGYDSSLVIFNQYPSSNPSKSSIWTISDYFNLYKDDFNKDEVQKNLINAARKIEQNKSSYYGEEHYEAALELIEQNKPLEAWNALVSASYWAGTNGRPDYVEKHWQKAIGLCKNQNWEDAYDALTIQWEWYQNYKKENNL